MENINKTSENVFKFKVGITKTTVILSISLVIIVLYLWHLGAYPLFNPDEGRYAEIPREMLQSRDFITPRLNGVEYFEKPVLQYWVTAFFMYVLGQNEFAVRLFPAICGLLGIGLTSFLAKKMFNQKIGLLSGIILATSFLYLIISSLNILDMAISFFITLSLVSFYQFYTTLKKKYLYLFYISMALGTLTKGLIAIVLVYLIVISFIVYTKSYNLLKKMCSIIGIGLFLVIVLPWFYLVCKENPDFFYFFFIQEHFLRYLTTIHHRYQPFYFFIPCVVLGIFPWTGFLFANILFKNFRSMVVIFKDNDKYIFLLLWFSIIFIFYSLSSSKLVPYIVPCLMPLSIIIASTLNKLDDKQIKVAIVINAIIAGVIVISFMIVALCTDFISIQDFLLNGSLLIIILIVFNIISLKSWYTQKNIHRLLAIYITFSLLFSFSLQPIMTEVAKHRTGKDVAQFINLWKNQDTLIITYKDYIQDIPFYTNSRVAIYDYLGELEFGANHPSGQGWFLDKTQLIKQWKNNSNMVLVVPKKYKEECFSTLNLKNISYVEINNYIIIRH